uniref:hypothetical protein n=1 Tax=Candidatus Cryptobacteroides bacterium TaxID=3085639 RepID=UPI004028C0EC
MSYECRKENGKDLSGHLEGVRGGGGGRSGGKRRSGIARQLDYRLVASDDTDDFVHDGCVRRLAPEAVSRRKAYNDAMAWLFTEKENPDLWMLKGSTTRDSDGHLH